MAGPTRRTSRSRRWPSTSTVKRVPVCVTITRRTRPAVWMSYRTSAQLLHACASFPRRRPRGPVRCSWRGLTQVCVQRRGDGRQFFYLRRVPREWLAVARLEQLVKVGGVKVARDKRGLVDQPPEKWQRGADARHHVFAQRAPKTRDGVRAMRAPDDQF